MPKLHIKKKASVSETVFIFGWSLCGTWDGKKIFFLFLLLLLLLLFLVVSVLTLVVVQEEEMGFYLGWERGGGAGGAKPTGHGAQLVVLVVFLTFFVSASAPKTKTVWLVGTSCSPSLRRSLNGIVRSCCHSSSSSSPFSPLPPFSLSLSHLRTDQGRILISIKHHTKHSNYHNCILFFLCKENVQNL